MGFPEDELPNELQFNTVLSTEISDALRDELAELQSVNGDIISVEAEFSRDVLVLDALSRIIAESAAGVNEDASQVSSAIYRGMCFGLQVADNVKSLRVKYVALAEFLGELVKGGSLVDQLAIVTNGYAADRSRVDALIAEFLPELEQGNQVPHHVETGAFVMLMLAERSMADEYFRQQVGDLSPSDFS